MVDLDRPSTGMVNVPQSPMLELRESTRPGANWNGGRNACAYALRSARFAVGRQGHLQQQPAPSQTDIRVKDIGTIASRMPDLDVRNGQ